MLKSILTAFIPVQKKTPVDLCRRYQITFTMQEVLTIIFFSSDFWDHSQQLGTEPYKKE